MPSIKVTLNSSNIRVCPIIVVPMAQFNNIILHFSQWGYVKHKKTAGGHQGSLHYPLSEQRSLFWVTGCHFASAPPSHFHSRKVDTEGLGRRAYLDIHLSNVVDDWWCGEYSYRFSLVDFIKKFKLLKPLHRFVLLASGFEFTSMWMIGIV